MRGRYSVESVERWRDRVHRRLPRLALTTRTKATNFVQEVGFCFVFRATDADLPSLCQAAQVGFSANGHIQRHPEFRDGVPSELGEILPRQADAYYAKLLLHRPTIVSLDYLPHFFAVSGRSGEKNEHVRQAMRGDLSPMARTIMEHLNRRSPQSTASLRRLAGSGERKVKGTFDLALTELQAKMYIAKTLEGQHSFSFLWAPVTELYAPQVRRARRISADAARHEILERYFRNQLIGSLSSIRRLFRWDRQDVFRSLGELMRRGIITPDVQVEGIHERQYIFIT
jgi:hypothetical protein